jgi:hypothetical protein
MTYDIIAIIRRLDDIRAAGADAVRAEVAAKEAAERGGGHANEIRCFQEFDGAVARVLGLITSPRGAAELAFLSKALSDAVVDVQTTARAS